LAQAVRYLALGANTEGERDVLGRWFHPDSRLLHATRNSPD
jgi:transposase-like protein